jgi:hypothetical protein
MSSTIDALKSAHAAELASRDAAFRKEMGRFIEERDILITTSQRTIAELTRERDEARGKLATYFFAPSGDVGNLRSCTCAAIQSADASRHFRECPMRVVYPEVAHSPVVHGPDCPTERIGSYDVYTCDCADGVRRANAPVVDVPRRNAMPKPEAAAAAPPERWDGDGEPTSSWVLGGCSCEPNYNHCATCDGRREVRKRWVRDHAPVLASTHQRAIAILRDAITRGDLECRATAPCGICVGCRARAMIREAESR